MPAAPFVIETFGVRWRVVPSALEDKETAWLRNLWVRAVVGEGDGPDHGTVEDFVIRSVEEEPVGAGVLRPPELSDLPYAMSRAMTAASITRQRGELLMLHAAGLSTLDGSQALALVASSGMGKSTASRVLGRHFGYLSDETVAIDADLRVLPYPKPLSLIVAADAAHRKEEHSPDDLALGPTPRRAPLAALVILERDEHVRRPTLTALDLVTGMVDVVAQSSSLNQLDHPLDRLARTVTVGGGPYRLTYAEIDDCRPLLTDLLAAAPEAPTLTWRHHPPPPERAHPADTALGTPAAPAELRGDALVCRAPWTDAVEAGDEVLVLIGDRPFRVSGIGTTLWLRAEGPISLDALTAAAVEVHGDHPEAPRYVGDAVLSLLAAGVLAECGRPRAVSSLPG